MPLGYDVKDHKLVANRAEAKTVRMVFERFVEIGSATILARELRADGVTSKQGKPISKGYLYRILNNRKLWDKVHAILTESPRKRASNTRAQTPTLLKGLLWGPDGSAFSPTHTRKKNRLYRYYVSQTVLRHGAGTCPVGRVPVAEIEAAVIDQLRAVFRQPEIIIGTWKAAKPHDASITETEAFEALMHFDPLWDELFPAEQARIVQLLVERVDIGLDGLDVGLRVDGLSGLVREMRKAVA